MCRGQLTEAETFPTTHRLPPQPPPQAPADPTPEPAGSGTTAATPLAKGPLSDALRESSCPLSAAITPLPHDPLSDALRACARPLPAAASVATSGHSSGHASTRLHSRIGPGLGHAAQSHARKKARQTLLPMASRSNPASSSHRTGGPGLVIEHCKAQLISTQHSIGLIAEIADYSCCEPTGQ